MWSKKENPWKTKGANVSKNKLVKAKTLALSQWHLWHSRDNVDDHMETSHIILIFSKPNRGLGLLALKLQASILYRYVRKIFLELKSLATIHDKQYIHCKQSINALWFIILESVLFLNLEMVYSPSVSIYCDNNIYLPAPGNSQQEWRKEILTESNMQDWLDN